MAEESVTILQGMRLFDGNNFPLWKMQIEDYLYMKDLAEPLFAKPEGVNEERWKKLDRKVLGAIRLRLADNVAHNVAKETTTAGAMKVLSDLYEKPSTHNKVSLVRTLFNLKMVEGSSVNTHLNNMNNVINQLETVGFKVEDEWKALIILASLPDSWEPMRRSVSHSAGKEPLNSKDVVAQILDEEIRRKESGVVVSGATLFVGQRKNNHGGKTDRGRFDKSVVCWGCGKKGHTKRQCKEEGVHLSSYEDALLITEVSSIDSWMLDSGASYHITGDSGILKNYVAGDLGKVRLADGRALNVCGMGDVDLRLSNGSIWKITKVRHVPNLTGNLISVGQLDADGYGVSFGSESWMVTKGARLVAKGQRSGTLYKVATKWELQGSSGVSKRRKRRGKRFSHPLGIMLAEKRCSDHTPIIDEFDQVGVVGQQVKEVKRNSSVSNPAWRYSKAPEKKKTKKVWQVKEEHGNVLDVGKCQRGDAVSYYSSIAKLVTFKDVLGLVKKTLKLGSTSVGVRG